MPGARAATVAALMPAYRVRFTHHRLPRRQVVSWRARDSGVVALDAEAPAGSASYLIRLRTR